MYTYVHPLYMYSSIYTICTPLIHPIYTLYTPLIHHYIHYYMVYRYVYEHDLREALEHLLCTPVICIIHHMYT